MRSRKDKICSERGSRKKLMVVKGWRRGMQGRGKQAKKICEVFLLDSLETYD